MRENMKGARIVVTGGCGFIGSALIRHLLAQPVQCVVNLDKMTYAATRESLALIETDKRYRLVVGDVAEPGVVERVLRETTPSLVFHLAAESHVDRSLDGPEAFMETNITGGFRVLEAALAWWRDLPDAASREAFRLVMVSTDEVYGALGPEDPPFREESPFRPNSPYAASKAASDHLARAWARSYDLPVIVTHCSNNYGYWQYPEKLIPVIIASCLDARAIPIYGDGGQVRDWIHVDDHIRALLLIAGKGRKGGTYMIGSANECDNLALTKLICATLDRLRARAGGPYEALVTFVADRPGHDRRYAVDAGLLRQELGWHPEETLETGIHRTVRWYLEREDWWRKLMDSNERQRRLGLQRMEAGGK